jgi:hypothetical protein
VSVLQSDLDAGVGYLSRPANKKHTHDRAFEEGRGVGKVLVV